MRLALGLLLSFAIALPANAQYAALTITRTPSRTGGTNRVVPVSAATGLVRRASFRYPIGLTGGCGEAPGAGLSNYGTGPLLSRDGRRIVYAAERTLVLRTVGVADPVTIANGPFDRPACLVALAADSSAVLYYRLSRTSNPPDPSEEGAPETATIDGVFEVYVFETGQTIAWRPDTSARQFEHILLLDAHTIATLENANGAGYRRRLALTNLADGTETEIARTEGHALTFGQLAYYSGSLVWLDQVGRTEFHVITPSSSGTRWSTLPGTWAEFQWNQISPSGRRLSRVHQVQRQGGAISTSLEILETGLPNARVVADDIYDHRWVDDDTLLVEQFREVRSRRRSYHLARIELTSGRRTELSSRPATASRTFVFAN